MAKNPYRVGGLGILRGYASDLDYTTSTQSQIKRGDIYYNTTTQSFRYFNGTEWCDLTHRRTRAIVRLWDDSSASVPSGPQVVDGVTANLGDFVLMSNVPSPGIYRVESGTWELYAELSQTNGSPVSGDSVWVQEGNTKANLEVTYNGSLWVSFNIVPGTESNSILTWDGSSWSENTSLEAGINIIKSRDNNINDITVADSLNISAGNKISGTGNGGELNLFGGNSSGGSGGNINITPGSGLIESGSVIIGGKTLRVDAQYSTDPTGGILGDIYYNTTENKFKYFDGTNWRPMGSGGGPYIVDYADTSATTISTTDPYSPDGTPVVVGDQVLFTNLTTLADRGVWEVTDITLGVITWTRKIHGQDLSGLSLDGDFVWVKFGTNHADKLFVCDNTITANWKDYGASLQFANRTLSNLISPTAINQHLLPNSDLTWDFGSSSLNWQNLYVKNIHFGAQQYIQFQSHSTAIRNDIRITNNGTLSGIDYGYLRWIDATNAFVSLFNATKVNDTGFKIFNGSDSEPMILVGRGGLNLGTRDNPSGASSDILIASGTATTTRGRLRTDVLSYRQISPDLSTEYHEWEVFGPLTLLDNQTNTTVSKFTFAYGTIGSIRIDYQIKANDDSWAENGTLNIVCDGTDVQISNDSLDTGSGSDVTWSAVISGSDVNVRYSSSNAGYNRTMRGTIRRWLA